MARSLTVTITSDPSSVQIAKQQLAEFSGMPIEDASVLTDAAIKEYGIPAPRDLLAYTIVP